MKMKITPDGYFIILTVIAILFHFLFPIAEIIPYPYSLCGVILILIGILIGSVTNSILMKKKTSIRPFETPRVLITSGPFTFSRNPIYLGMAIAIFGVAIIPGSLSRFISPIIFVIIIDKSFIPAEENNLKELFGQQYFNYEKKVRRWI